MLRYNHKLPEYYESSFIRELNITAITYLQLEKQAKLMDLLCLLQLIHYNPYSERPALNRDVVFTC
jgi:hypothetical protein